MLVYKLLKGYKKTLKYLKKIKRRSLLGAMHNEVFHLAVKAVSVVHKETLLRSMLLN